jgi:hypothetical protein
MNSAIEHGSWRLAPCAQHARQFYRTRQAADMRGQQAVCAGAHQSVMTEGKSAERSESPLKQRLKSR